MIVNLGLVELGGEQIDGVQLDGYIFRFAEADLLASQIRTYYALRRLLSNWSPYPEMRVWVNYNDPAMVAVATKMLVEHKHMCEHIALIFQDEKILVIK